MTDRSAAAGGRRAAVLGSPVSHSKSPQLHLAAYRELGLVDWTYDRIECTAEGLPALLDGFGPEWVGVSVTMPGKFAALEYTTDRTERAAAVGSANTLVRTSSGWRADCTDVDGVTGALATVGVRSLAGASAVVVGAGGTSRPALVAMRDLGARTVTVVSRSEERASGALACGRSAGLTVRWCGVGDEALGDAVLDAAVVVSTVPADAGAVLVPAVRHARVLLDAIYHPWPTPLATAVGAEGGAVAGGLQMLLAQAYGQVEQFTGRSAPREAMAAALT